MIQEKLKMLTLQKDELFFLIRNNYDIIFATLLSIGVSLLLSKASRRVSSERSGIPGRQGIPFLGETLSFLSATNSTKGVYDFVRLRRLWHGKWFKTSLFGKTHVFVPSTEGAKAIFTNDFALFNKGFVKSMADAVGKKSLLCVPQESHKRIRRLLSDPFSMNSLSKFVQKFDYMLCERLKKLEEDGKSFVLLKFNMKIAFDAMCNMLMSITDTSLLQQIERDCTAISDAMLSFPVMIPGTRYYKGIKARTRIMKTFEAMIACRRRGKESREDFLQTMLQRDSYPANEKLDDSEIMDNLLTLIIAGQTTTAAAMMWSVKFLDENREVQDRLREEQLAILKNKPDGYLLTLEDLNNMSYASKEIQKPYSYIPFGAGPRTCLGINMAKATMSVFLHRLTGGYRWTVDDPDPSLERKAHIPRLRSGCPITLMALQDHNTNKHAMTS
ncbi:hypothetical protein Acr_01g0001640 [Actinidia rufa]|uniref:Uncharacterized protein n=1 Tax=Actinidia rufa TaxID=165716 RepID=A0A7J0E1G8_9ERIC|nr:hypothetical protein Acr_01g0001640 [Actinidia rufa]